MIYVSVLHALMEGHTARVNTPTRQLEMQPVTLHTQGRPLPTSQDTGRGLRHPLVDNGVGLSARVQKLELV